MAHFLGIFWLLCWGCGGSVVDDVILIGLSVVAHK
jgi:hypothetical protein